ncbi:hypothetical protein Cob_v002143 [Colletotrichum orbiculare MAFF 240422]|uniref:Uncharacterized protein n=1 Tax=Colletotrichum orbiculare (strain 104-T / ATCC 96160 / CBS 514.97 / LARS 414 / MAFF 240422) TaxID=1213857 RepID=A0A484G3K3_COLOR|nr:hypothetical protein Cob_v002143 [Colletotrichum orbiculare MAFF 240422]
MNETATKNMTETATKNMTETAAKNMTETAAKNMTETATKTMLEDETGDTEGHVGDAKEQTNSVDHYLKALDEQLEAIEKTSIDVQNQVDALEEKIRSAAAGMMKLLTMREALETPGKEGEAVSLEEAARWDAIIRRGGDSNKSTERVVDAEPANCTADDKS